MNECGRTQITRRTSRAMMTLCPCGCQRVGFSIVHFGSPDGFRWIFLGEEVFVSKEHATRGKNSVDMTA